MVRPQHLALSAAGALAVLALIDVSYLTVHAGLGKTGNRVVSAVTAFLLLTTALRLRVAICNAVLRVARFLNALPRGTFWAVLGVLAFGGRIALFALLQPVPASDGAIYVALGHSLAHQGAYVQPPTEVDPDGCLACYPPGLPLLLSLLYRSFGDHEWIPLLLNLGVLAAQVLVLKQLTVALRLPSIFRLCAVLLLLWPSVFLYSLTPNKELLAGLAVSVIVLVQIRLCEPGLQRSTRTLGMSALSGALCGFAALTQPSWLLLPIALVVFGLLAGQSPGRAAANLAIVVLAMAATIAPWTVRNMQVLGAFVPVSSNGGVNFYMVNNPLATGSWTRDTQRSLKGYGEVQRNRLGMKWGEEWIAGHPMQFTSLAIKKQLIVLGGDDTGAYWAIERGTELHGDLFAWARLVSTAFWAALWVIMLAGASYKWRVNRNIAPAFLLVIGPLLYLLAMHAVFEAQPKHHLQVAALIVLMACACALPAELSEGDVRA